MIPVQDIPDQIRDLCIEWYDGANSVMYRIAFRTTEHPNAKINPKALLKEIRGCLSELSIQKEEARLRSAEDWCLRQIDRAAAVAAIHRVAERARNMGLTSDEFFEIANQNWRTPA